jgi:flagellar biosynthesis protein FlhF
MKILKFEGATMKDAVAKVKAELGENAVIMATRQIRRGLLGSGYEISAAIEDEAPAPAPQGPMSRYGSGPTVAPPLAQPTPPGPTPEDFERLIAPMRSELRSLRALIRAADAKPAGDPELRSEIQQLRRLVEGANAPAAANVANAVANLARTLGTNPTAEKTRRTNEPSLVAGSTARVVMLVGPTGVGKTTTIAKLAARAALVENKRVEIITLDDYRVGGLEQIRTFADLIGVRLTAASDAATFADALDTDADLILIDTAGRSPRDTDAIDALAQMIEDVNANIEVHVAVSAAMSTRAIDGVLKLYRALAPTRLLFTKVDEVDCAPELAEAPRRLRLPITWITTGQAVPEDLEEPTTERVLDLSTHGLPDLRGRAA